MTRLVPIARGLCEAVRGLGFGDPVEFVYSPLEYAWEVHRAYLERYGGGPKEALLLGMNPGPWGMAQTGVPFGDPVLVRDWLGLEGQVGRPLAEHPKRRVLGLSSPRREVSGRRLWGWARERFGSTDAFFSRFLVWNHCPLAFLAASGRNLTPDKLPRAEAEPLEAVCDEALCRVVAALSPSLVIGVGAWAERRARAALGDSVPIGRILHPSPASPAANRGWAEQAEAQLASLGVSLP